MIDFAKNEDAIFIFLINSADFKNIIHEKNIRVEILSKSSLDLRCKTNLFIAFDSMSFVLSSSNFIENLN